MRCFFAATEHSFSATLLDNVAFPVPTAAALASARRASSSGVEAGIVLFPPVGGVGCAPGTAGVNGAAGVGVYTSRSGNSTATHRLGKRGSGAGDAQHCVDYGCGNALLPQSANFRRAQFVIPRIMLDQLNDLACRPVRHY